MGAAVLITDIVALPVGSLLLSKDLWLPYWFSTPIILLAFPIIIAIPETVPKNKDAQSDMSSQHNDRISASQSEQVNIGMTMFYRKAPQLITSLRTTFSCHS
jgi:hypothetical protein